MIRGTTNRSGGLYCDGKGKGAVQLFEHLVCCSELTILSILLVLGDTCRIWFESIEGSPSAAKSDHGALNSIPVDTSKFSGFVAKAIFRVFEDLTESSSK